MPFKNIKAFASYYDQYPAQHYAPSYAPSYAPLCAILFAIISFAICSIVASSASATEKLTKLQQNEQEDIVLLAKKLEQRSTPYKIVDKQNIEKNPRKSVDSFWQKLLERLSEQSVGEKKQKPTENQFVKSKIKSMRAELEAWSYRIKNVNLFDLAHNLVFGAETANNLPGDYLSLAHAEFLHAFPRASEIATRLTDNIQTEEVLERALLAHMRAGDFEQALPLAKRLKKTKSVHGFIARFLLASKKLQQGDAAQAQKIIGDISGFGDFVRHGAPTYRFWIAFALNDTRGEKDALRELKQESLENFAQLLRLYAALAREEKRNVQEILREGVGNSNNFSILWAQGLHHARSGEKNTALSILAPFKNQLQANSLFLDELYRRIENGNIKKLLPSAEKENVTFFLARSLADLASAERTLGAKLMFARIAQKTDPESDYAKMLLSDALAEYQQLDEAMAVSNKVAGQSIYFRQSQLQQAEILRKQQRIDEAVEILKNMQAAREDDILAWWYAGSFYRSEDKHAEALPYFNRAIYLYEKQSDEFSKNKREPYWRLFYERGIALEQNGVWSKAEKDFLKALRLSPEQPMVMNYLAYTWLDLESDEHYQEALNMLQLAVGLRKRSGAVADSLGWAYYRLREYDNALETLEQAITFEPEDPTINDHLGDVYWRVGRLLEARYQWARVLLFETEDVELLKSVQQKLESGLPN